MVMMMSMMMMMVMRINDDDEGDDGDDTYLLTYQFIFHAYLNKIKQK